MPIAQLTDETFDTHVSEADQPVVVEFSAEWCGPCKQLEPVLESLAVKHADQFDIARVDVDKSPLAPSKFGVRGIPTLVVFRGGMPVATTVGAMPETRLLQWIEDNVYGDQK